MLVISNHGHIFCDAPWPATQVPLPFERVAWQEAYLLDLLRKRSVHNVAASGRQGTGGRLLPMLASYR